MNILKRTFVTVMTLFLCTALWCGATAIEAPSPTPTGPVTSIEPEENCPPVAENLCIETCRGVPFEGQLVAEDPEGDEITFVITTPPGKGVIDLNDDGNFVYTPAAGKRGRDYFGYRAVDSQGNRSQEATVIIKLLKQTNCG